MGRKVETEYVRVALSGEARRYLTAIAKFGIHGKTPSEVAKTFIGNELERLVIREGMLTKKIRPGGK